MMYPSLYNLFYLFSISTTLEDHLFLNSPLW